MQPSVNTTKNKLNGKFKNTLGTIQDIIEKQPQLKKNLEDVIDTEKHLFDKGVKEVSGLARYVRTNWKTVLPALAVLGVGTYFYRSTSKKIVKKVRNT